MNRWDRLMQDLIKDAHDVYNDPSSNKHVKGFILDLSAALSAIFQELAAIQARLPKEEEE